MPYEGDTAFNSTLLDAEKSSCREQMIIKRLAKDNTQIDTVNSAISPKFSL